MNKLFIISGPAGVGKGTLIRELLAKETDLQLSVSHTTREKRKGEVNGKDYHFVSKQTFEKLLTQDFFIESAIVHGNYYGTAKKEIITKMTTGNVLMEIDVTGAKNIKEKFSEAVLIFIQPPSWEELKKRLTNRGTENTQTIDTRLNTAKNELKNNNFFDYFIVNDRIDCTLEKIRKIISGGYDG